MSRKREILVNGFTILELLITLAITGLLLAAVAAAFNASVKSHTQNQALIKAIGASQAALSRITTQLRCAEAVDSNSPANECGLITDTGDDITYRYNSTDKKVYLIDNTAGTSNVLCDNVTFMTFQKETATDEGTTYVKNVQIKMTIAIGKAERTVSAAAVIRRNLPH